MTKPSHTTQKILVTGGNGYIGNALIHHLVDHYEVVSVDPSVPLLDQNKQCEYHRMNIASSEFTDLFRTHHFDAVFHLGASISVPESIENPSLYYNNNFSNTKHLLDLCVAEEVKNFIFSSTAAVYSEADYYLETNNNTPNTPYGRSKLMVEWLLEDYAKVYPIHYVALRYFNVAGACPKQRYGHPDPLHSSQIINQAISAAFHDKPFYLFGNDYDTPDQTPVRDFIHINDLIHAKLKSFEFTQAKQSSVFNVGYGKGFSVKEVIDSVQRITGKSIQVIVQDRRPGDIASCIAQADKIKKNLDWNGQFDSLDTIISHAWNWLNRLYTSNQ